MIYVFLQVTSFLRSAFTNSKRGFVSGKKKKFADITQISVYFDNKLWTLKKVQVRNILSSILFQAGRATF